MTAEAIRPGWGPFSHGWYCSTDGRFEIFVVGWSMAPQVRARRRDGSTYGYDLYEGDVKHGRFPYVEAAMAEAKNLRSRDEKS